MKKTSFQYYTNDVIELQRRDREYLIHQEKLVEIKRSKTAFLKNRSSSKKLSRSFNLKDELRSSDVYAKNQKLAFNLAKIHCRPNNHLQLSPFRLHLSNSKERVKEQNIKIFDENMQLCKRILEQQSQIDFPQKLQDYQQLEKIQKRLQRVKRQFQQQDKLGTQYRIKAKSVVQAH